MGRDKRIDSEGRFNEKVHIHEGWWACQLSDLPLRRRGFGDNFTGGMGGGCQVSIPWEWNKYHCP